ncbi:MAG: endonuclease/exonuclease/phosphatase family protein [Bacteroidia bacterium]|nr:endonuclease/exonuclease/phosphatase family protein [Bacteroidia bacterium]
MKKATKIIIRLVLVLVLMVAVYLGGVILYGTLSDYEPPETEPVTVNVSPNHQPLPDTLDFMIWNIGYAGLGKEMDFFYDGGERVEPPREWFDKYLNGVKTFLGAQKGIEFFLLQEVDRNSARSYYQDELKEIASVLPGYDTAFALNYNVGFVPMPLSNPMGQTYAGLLTLTNQQVTQCERRSFPGNFDWPKSVFMLDRCFMVSRVPASEGRELVVINTHNSAYDDGTLKAQQMEYLKSFILEEYEKGNFVIVGGDWNQNPPNYMPSIFASAGMPTMPGNAIDVDFLPEDWRWAYDATLPTNRDLSTAFDAHTSARGIIDFYLVSPNVRIQRVEGMDLGFEFSDHQPVKMRVLLNGPAEINDSLELIYSHE